MALDKQSGWLVGCGIFAVVVGAFLAGFWSMIFFAVVKMLMTLTPSSTSFDIWNDIPIPMYFEATFFNITNIDEILDRSDPEAWSRVKPIVSEIGPYVYEESMKKVDLVWHENNTVTYRNLRYWHFVPERSVGSESDLISSINPIVPTVAYFVRNQGAFIRMAAGQVLRLTRENMFITANVSEWMFTGFDDPLLRMARNLPFDLNLPFDRFAWFYGRNGSTTYDGIFNMNTGAGDFSQLGNTEMWNYSNQTSYEGECGRVKGSAGELWAPEHGQPTITVFVGDICTSLELTIGEEIEFLGVTGQQYVANASLFDNGYNYPAKACYCDTPRDENCMPPGNLNVSSCRYGAPAFMSQPHFLNSDPYYPSKVEGLHPSEEYNFRMALEMTTGMPLVVDAQLQLNILVRHVNGIEVNSAFPDPDLLIPMLWFNQQVQMIPRYANLAKLAVNVDFYFPIALYCLTAIGILLLVGGVYVMYRKSMKSSDTAPIIDNEIME